MAVWEVPHWGQIIPQVAHLACEGNATCRVNVYGCVHYVDV